MIKDRFTEKEFDQMRHKILEELQHLPVQVISAIKDIKKYAVELAAGQNPNHRSLIFLMLFIQSIENEPTMQ